MCLRGGVCLDVAYSCLIQTRVYACAVRGNNILEGNLQPFVAPAVAKAELLLFHP